MKKQERNSLETLAPRSFVHVRYRERKRGAGGGNFRGVNVTFKTVTDTFQNPNGYICSVFPKQLECVP